MMEKILRQVVGEVKGVVEKDKREGHGISLNALKDT